MSAIDIEVAAALRSQAIDSSVQRGPVDIPQGGGFPMDFHGFDFVELKGRPEHEGELPIPGEPKPGPATALAELSGLAETVQFRLLDEAGVLIESIDLQLPEGEPLGFAYFGEFTVPDEPFRVAAAGTDLDGLAFDVTYEHLFKPQTIEVRFDPEFLLVEPGLVGLDATVTNMGPAGTFAIEVITNLGLDVSSDVIELELAESTSAPIVVTLDVPAISSGVLDILVTATATSITDPDRTNHGSTLARIEKFEKVFWDGFD